MRIYPVASAENGEFITPNEMNAELKAIVSTLGTLDRDNFRTLAKTKVAANAFGALTVSQTEDPIEVSHEFGPVDLDALEIHTIPFSVGSGVIAPWVVPFTSGDCELEICLSVTYQSTDLESYVWVGVRVDGELVGRSPTQPIRTSSDCGFVACTVPVGPGEHLVEAVYGRAWSEDVRTLTFADRVMSIREIAR